MDLSRGGKGEIIVYYLMSRWDVIEPCPEPIQTVVIFNTFDLNQMGMVVTLGPRYLLDKLFLISESFS